MRKSKKLLDNTDLLASGEVTFCITKANEIRLNALSKYAQMLDFVTNAEEKITIDGVINEIIESACVAKIKAICKRHGFGSEIEFCDAMMASESGEKAHDACVESEIQEYNRAHEKILSHEPIPDKQSKFDFAK